jgi:hypothetical protein
MGDKRVRNVGKVDKIRGSDDLQTIGFEMDADLARKLATELNEAAKSGQPVYLWTDKQTKRVHLTVAASSGHFDEEPDLRPTS